MWKVVFLLGSAFSSLLFGSPVDPWGDPQPTAENDARGTMDPDG